MTGPRPAEAGGARTRRTVSLTARLVAIVLLLLAAAVGTFGWSSLGTLDDLARSEAAARRRAGEQNIRRQGELIARNAAMSAALPLAEGNTSYLESLAVTTIADDPSVLWIVIADEPSGRVIARAGTAPGSERLEDGHREEVAAAPASQAVSWRDPGDATRWTFGIRSEVTSRPVGQIRIGITTAALEAELATSLAEARDRARSSARDLLLWAGIILLAGVVLGVVQGVRMTRPLKALALQAARIAGGDLEHRVQVSSHDEIGRLADDFNYMADRLGALLRETATKASLEREMDLARNVQESMIPPPIVVTHGACRVIGHCRPATSCGGDWWTVRPLGPSRVLVAVGDVTGHGVPSAMIAATARGAIDALTGSGDLHMGPQVVLRAIDGCLRGMASEQRLLMTCFVAIVDSARGTLEYANAGHNFPYLLHAGSPGRITTSSVLTARGGLLGDAGADFGVEAGTLELTPGDIFVCYSDGLVDRVDAAGGRFGDRRLLRLLTNRDLPADGEALSRMCEEVLGAVEAFSGGVPPDDDVTLVLCHYAPAAATRESRPLGAVG